MNIQTAIVLIVIAAAVVFALRVRRKSGNGCCDGCDSCSSCPSKDSGCGSCRKKK